MEHKDRKDSEYVRADMLCSSEKIWAGVIRTTRRPRGTSGKRAMTRKVNKRNDGILVVLDRAVMDKKFSWHGSHGNQFFCARPWHTSMAAWSKLLPSLSQQKSCEEMQEEDKEGDEGIEKELQEDEGVGSASSSSSSSASASDIIWVSPQSLQLKADVWTTNLYNISKKAVSNGKLQMKCLECEKNSVKDDWGCGNQIYNGTAMPQ